MKKPPSKSEGLRLTIPHWVKLRELIQAKGRAWLESIIDREHRKLTKEPKPTISE
jgi:hypothetical protein